MPKNDESVDSLVREKVVAEELAVTTMSLRRWDTDSEMIALGWPPPVHINRWRFRSRSALEAFKSKLAMQALQRRGKLLARR